MDFLTIMQKEEPYYSKHGDMPLHLQKRARKMLKQIEQIEDEQSPERGELLNELFGTYHPLAFPGKGFCCDFGFNIHFHGLAVINYNVVMLDTSPIHIGNGAFIGPGVCLACAGHAFLAEQRRDGICSSKPITLEDDVWIGANATICGGVTIGAGSIIGAGSVVTKDIPAGVIAAGTPCKVIREITEEDRIVL